MEWRGGGGSVDFLFCFLSFIQIIDYYTFIIMLCLHSIEKVQQVRSKILVIHGTEDEVIDFSHGLALYERAPQTVDPLWVEGAGHNDVELYSQYLDRLRRFVQQELGSSLNS